MFRIRNFHWIHKYKFDSTLEASGGSAVRQVIVYPGENGFYVVACPSLPGCISQGLTKEEAIVNIKEAIQVYSEALTDQGLTVPVERFDSMLIAV